MAIIAVLAAVLAPSVTDGIDRAYAAAEERNANMLMAALEQHVLQNKQIPRETVSDWTAAIAAYADLSRDDVEFNARGYRRRLYVDPQFFSSSEAVFPGYSQTTGLGSRPYSPRLMLVSDLNRNAPNPPRTAADFAAIWDQTGSATVVESTRVKVVRLNLSGRFHRLLLINSHSQQPAYALEAGSPVPVPPAAGGADGTLTRYVLSASRLAVFFSPYPSGGANTSTLVREDVAMHYTTDGSSWFWERS
jgi:type II secretory pathway pseudopilin PulG